MFDPGGPAYDDQLAAEEPAEDDILLISFRRKFVSPLSRIPARNRAMPAH
jgi:hypothetical protein